jgi:hypothetical protein
VEARPRLLQLEYVVYGFMGILLLVFHHEATTLVGSLFLGHRFKAV